MATGASLLSSRSMTSMIRATKSGIPLPLPPEFFVVSRRVRGNTCSYRKINGNRQVARIVQYGSPAARRKQKGWSEIPITLAHSLESQPYDPLAIMTLLNPENNTEQSMGEAEIARQMRWFKMLFSNLRHVGVLAAVLTGRVYIDADGNVLGSASGASHTIDFGIPAANRGQIGGIIKTSWDAADADIIGQVTALQDHAVETTGYPLKYAFYGGDVPSLLANNAAVKALIEASPALTTEYISTANVPQGLMGLTWVPVKNAMFLDQNMQVVKLTPSDGITFWPEPSLDNYELIEGSAPVPREFGPAQDALEAIGNMEEVFGQFSYAVSTHNPVGVEQFVGDTFLGVPKVPASVFMADVVFEGE